MSGALLGSVAGCHRAPAPDVMATVNGKDILRADLDRKYQTWKMSQGESPQEPSAEQVDLARLAILRQMIDEEILQQRAAKLNVTASDEDVNAKLTEMKAPYTQEEFDKQLKQRNETLDNLKAELRQGLTENKLLNKEIDSKINITDAEITGYYEAHKADFNFIEPRYNIARIVVTNAPSQQTTNLQNNKASGEADAKNKIQALHQKLENGEDFGVVAMNFSEDKDSASNGGDMGFVTESQLHGAASAEVYDAISKLKPGQFSEVLPINGGPTPSRKPIGYAIYKLISKEAAGQRTLNDVRVQQAIRQSLRDGHAQLLKNAYFEVLRDDAKVHNYLADQILREGAK
ncbi:MAG TPA: SurA N-terminal domain-containing protein [Terracidiphilus sp.]|nr:SurA N-terminal domain-containing protein [Terracidiphilus sp.]